jgi:hypothetical protein
MIILIMIWYFTYLHIWFTLDVIYLYPVHFNLKVMFFTWWWPYTRPKHVVNDRIANKCEINKQKCVLTDIFTVLLNHTDTHEDEESENKCFKSVAVLA